MPKKGTQQHQQQQQRKNFTKMSRNEPKKKIIEPVIQLTTPSIREAIASRENNASLNDDDKNKRKNLMYMHSFVFFFLLV